MTTESRYHSRKFILACAAFLASLVLLFLGMLDAELWAENMRWILGLYFTGNVGMAAVSKITEKKNL